jgi:hypothetical protein
LNKYPIFSGLGAVVAATEANKGVIGTRKKIKEL